MNHLIKQLPASAFILAGGKSKRFESPKWKAMLGGITLLQRSWNLCTDLFESISIVAKSNYDFGEKRLIQDILNVQAPLTGIYTALKQSEHKWNFIISCDLPFISEEIILKLWDKTSDECDSILPITSRGIEPTCSFYSITSLPTIEHMIENGNLSLHDLNKHINHAEVDFIEETNLFLNVNSQNDLKNAEQQILKSKNN